MSRGQQQQQEAFSSPVDLPLARDIPEKDEGATKAEAEPAMPMAAAAARQMVVAFALLMVM